jgi:hypothetical protein
VYNIRLGKNDDGVAVSMLRRKVQRPNILAIQVHGNVMVESDNGQRDENLVQVVCLHCGGVAQVATRATDAFRITSVKEIAGD